MWDISLSSQTADSDNECRSELPWQHFYTVILCDGLIRWLWRNKILHLWQEGLSSEGSSKASWEIIQLNLVFFGDLAVVSEWKMRVFLFVDIYDVWKMHLGPTKWHIHRLWLFSPFKVFFYVLFGSVCLGSRRRTLNNQTNNLCNYVFNHLEEETKSFENVSLVWNVILPDRVGEIRWVKKFFF